MDQFFSGLSGNLISFLIYAAIAIVALTGLFKCILPTAHLSRQFRRAIRALEMMSVSEGASPVWRNPLFLGKGLLKEWKRFLLNAEQLDARGLSCDTEDYINDDTALAPTANLRAGEIIPGLLTSFGILGTFIGLMRGVSGLDVTTADSTMKSISQMLGGMTFAYGTSIAGLTCSLFFNILYRWAQGGATSAMDDFHTVFRETVMQQPLDESVHNICYQEDQAVFLRNSASDMSNQLSSGISTAIDRAFAPIGQQMNQFITVQTENQLEGLGRMVDHFMRQMDAALGGQFNALAHSLQAVSQKQDISCDSAGQALAAADALIQNMNQLQGVSAQVIERFDAYVNDLAAAQAGNAHLAGETSNTLSQLYANLQHASDQLTALKNMQLTLDRQMQDYANWSGRVLEAVEKQSDAASLRTHEVANEMASSGKLLKDSYAEFVENITKGLARTMGMFEENMRDMMDEFAKRILEVKAQKDPPDTADLKAVARLEDAIGEMTRALKEAAGKEKGGQP